MLALLGSYSSRGFKELELVRYFPFKCDYNPNGGIPIYKAVLAVLISGSYTLQVLDSTSIATPYIIGLALYLLLQRGLA